MKILTSVLIALITHVTAHCQTLPKDLTLALSNAMRPTFAADSVNMFTVVVCLGADGQLRSTGFSDGTPAIMKDDILHRISVMRIGLRPLPEYWIEFCRKNGIGKDTYIIQSNMVRSDQTGHLEFTAAQVAEKFSRAMRFDERALQFRQNVNIIWLPPKVAERRQETIKE